MKRPIIFHVFLLAALALAAGAAERKPNILFIAVDDLRLANPSREPFDDPARDPVDRRGIPQKALRIDPQGTPKNFQTQSIEGWTVHVSDVLMKQETTATLEALALMRGQLQAIVRVVPAPALAILRTVPLWLTPTIPGQKPRAEYHPNVEWLRENGRDPAMAKAVQFTNIAIFAQETRRMPVFVFHELAHAYHDQVYGFDNPEIKAAWQRAAAGTAYKNVKQSLGDQDHPVTAKRAYALTNPMEYFAEDSEAFFARNDFYPFERAELERADPEMARLLLRLWHCNEDQPAAAKASGQ